MERLLLIELVAVHRFHRAIGFPFLHGFARQAGAPVRWLRFGVPGDVRLERRERGFGLDAASLASLGAELAAFAPTRVVLNLEPSGSLRAALRRGAPAAALAVLDGGAGRARPGRALRRLGDDVADWAALIGVEAGPGAPRPFWEAVIPHWGYTAANAAAASIQPLPFVVMGEECTYDRPLSANPAFAGVDLPAGARRGGCAFCARRPSRGDGPRWAATAAFVRAQLDAVAATVPRPRGRLAVRLAGELGVRHAPELARLCRDSALPPSDLLLDARADAVVARQGALAEACEALRGSGHRLEVALIGIESFSRAELARMNKGLTPLQSLDAALALLRLREQYPETFAFREHGGFSLILFTPWTTLDDLATSLSLIEGARLAPACSGKLFTSRLRLEPTLPLTALARRDGLLLERYADPLLDTAARNLYGEELPWRFADARLEPICSALVRLSTDTRLEGDALAARLERTRATARARGWSDLDLALALIERARLARDAAPGPEALLEAVERGLDASAPGAQAARAGDVEPDLDLAVAALAAMCREGLKPVARFEPLDRAGVDAILASFDLPVVRVRHAVAGGPFEVFGGTRAREVDRAVALAALAEAPPRPEIATEALAELGLLLGYPDCCVDAFVRSGSSGHRASYNWVHLANRMSFGGAVSPLFNPWAGPLSAYVPCRLGCERSARLAERAFDIVARALPRGIAEELQRRMEHPWLVSLRAEGAALELVPERGVSERFRCRPGAASRGCPELALAAEADEVLLDAERLVLLRGGREHAELTGRAFVWWHERPLQAPLWTRVLALRDALAASDRAARAADDGLRLRPEVEAIRRWLDEALADMARRGLRPGGLEGWALDAASPERLRLRLGAGPDTVVLDVTSAGGAATRSLFRIGDAAFSYPADHPLDSPRRRAATLELARHLKARLASGR